MLRLRLQPARLRRTALLAITLGALAAAWYWLGNAAAGLTALFAWPLLCQQRQPMWVVIEPSSVKQYWMLDRVICVVSRRQHVWIFADELDAAQFSALRCRLVTEVTSQPVGLRISN